MRSLLLAFLLSVLLYTNNAGSNDRQEGGLAQNAVETEGSDGYMVGKGLEEGSGAWESRGGWSLPSYETVQGWASSAYSKLPSYQTVTSYLPGAVQQHMPSQQTIDSYIPSMEDIRNGIAAPMTYLQTPLNYFKRRLFGGYEPEKLLTEGERDRLVKALSDKILNKDGGESIQGVMEQLAPRVAGRAQNNVAPIVIRLVVHRVIYAMAVAYIGPLGAFLVREHIDGLADAVAERAVDQYVNAGPNRIDLYSYLKKIDWVSVYEYLKQLVTSALRNRATY